MSGTSSIPLTVSGAASPVSTATTPVSPVASLIASASVLLQLPQIPRFNGDEGETFQDWHEQFESIAVAVFWEVGTTTANWSTLPRGYEEQPTLFIARVLQSRGATTVNWLRR